MAKCVHPNTAVKIYNKSFFVLAWRGLQPYNAIAGLIPTPPRVHNVRFLCKQTLQRFQRFSSCGYLSDRRFGAIEFVLLRSTFTVWNSW